MKTTIDPRHQKRVELMKSLFSYSFHPSAAPNKLSIKPIISTISQIDTLIHQCAPEWPIEQINRIDLSILRLSIHELLLKENPYKVVIDEAVELAKEYGSESSPKFINGVLGTALNQIKP